MAAIPTLAHEDLEQLGEREQQGAQRKEVLAAIAERLLESASQKLDETKSTSGNSGQTDPNMQQDKNQQQTSEPNGVNEQNLPSADQPSEPANPVDSDTAQ
ncbi:hypothetical protein [Paludibacterium denitrificans]|uniref:Uncharacterized protein n=1 Tax=Paludibacterium denitrificans TaxID=2675226 RepID=A0A844GAT8_9NEIS|nr:hypothetical protein [Paludibacterium denitrificans]MTD32401.1 hypothetical protein [Paludibacterium denitrificans]